MSFQNPADRRTTSDKNIHGPDRLATLRDCLEKGPVVVEHRFYNRGRSPNRVLIDDYEELLDYLEYEANAGDVFYFWDFAAVCHDDNVLVSGKWPDGGGRVPETGAY